MKVSDSDPTTLINFDIAAVITGVIKATGIVIELRKAICTGQRAGKVLPDPRRSWPSSSQFFHLPASRCRRHLFTTNIGRTMA